MCIRDRSVGRNESNLVIGKHSGRNAVRNKFESLGYSLDDDQLQIVFEAVKALADRKKTLHDDDLMACLLYTSCPRAGAGS